MLITQGPDRTDAVDRRLACTLAAIAGALNAAAFQAVGFFAANMTGNVSTVSDNVALGHWLVGAFYLSIVLTFIAGAVVSTLVINAGKRREIRSIYAVCVLTEGTLMVLLGWMCGWLPHTWQAPLLVLGLSFLMGLQNAIVTTISGARVRTTHISGMTTDIGIELSMLFDIARGREPALQTEIYRSRLRLHLQTVMSFLGGGIAGVLIFQRLGQGLLFVVACLLLALALNGFWRVRAL